MTSTVRERWSCHSKVVLLLVLCALVLALPLGARGAHGQPSPLQHVLTNAGLGKTSTATYTILVRDGWTTAGDTAPITFTASSSPCPISGGDGGSQVPSSDGKCWIWNPPSGGVAPTEFGAKGDGSTDDTSAVQHAISAASVAGIPLVFDSSHLYKTSSTLTVTSPVHIEGAYRFGSWTTNSSGPLGSATCPFGILNTSNADILTVTAITSSVHGLCIQASSNPSAISATGGAAIRVAPPSTSTYQTGVSIQHNTILAPYIGISIDGAGYSSGCCGQGTTADGNEIAWNTVVSPAAYGISNGANTAGSATAGNTYWDNTITCYNSTSRTSGTGFALFDGGITYNGTNNGPESCNIGFLIQPGAVSGQSQNAQAVLSGALGDQSGLHDFVIQPRTGGSFDFVQIDNAWVGATGNVTSFYVNCQASGTSCQELNITNLVAHGGANLTGPVMDFEAGAGGPYDVTITGSNICERGTPMTGALGLKLNIQGAYSGRFSIVGNRIGTGCPGSALPIGIWMAIGGGSRGHVVITGNDLSGVYDAGGAPLAYTPTPANDLVILKNNLGIDDQAAVVPSNSTIILPYAGQIILTGSTPVTTMNNAWSGRQVLLSAFPGPLSLNGGGNICNPSNISAPYGSIVATYNSGDSCWYLH